MMSIKMDDNVDQDGEPDENGQRTKRAKAKRKGTILTNFRL